MNNEGVLSGIKFLPWPAFRFEEKRVLFAAFQQEPGLNHYCDQIGMAK